MPRYEYRCRDCDVTFEVSRPMSASGDPAVCPGGHADTVKLLSTVALAGVGGRAAGRAAQPAPAAGGGGGCCGGGCCG